MSDELKIFLEKNPNPWEKIQESYYVLGNEEDAVQNEQYKFHTELPPQPFQGNPDAPIWILALNPGYSEKTDKYPVPDAEYYKNHDERRKAMLDQLKFQKSGDHWHYVLDNEDGNYSKEWFKEHFIKKKDMGVDENNVDENIFILQAFGYASETFYGDVNEMAKSFPHMQFAQELARWGLEHGRIIVIARCKEYWLNVLEAEKYPENFNNIYFFSSSRNISFSAGNIVNWHEYQLLKKKSAAKLQVIIKNQ